jgi:hypothetical protein
MKRILILVCFLINNAAFTQCLNTTSVTVTPTVNGGTATWPAVVNAQTYSIAIFTHPGNVFTGVQTVTSSTTWTFTGLNANTLYRFQIATICIGGGTSTGFSQNFTTQTGVVACTPMTAACYSYKYLKVDSMLHVSAGDTSLLRADRRGGAIVFKNSDSTFYGWNGLKWETLGGSGANNTTPYVDTIYLNGDTLKYKKNNVIYGITIAAKTLQQVTEAGATTDQDILFENKVSWLDSLGFTNKATVKAKSLNSILERFYFTGSGGDIATRQWVQGLSSLPMAIDSTIQGANVEGGILYQTSGRLRQSSNIKWLNDILSITNANNNTLINSGTPNSSSNLVAIGTNAGTGNSASNVNSIGFSAANNNTGNFINAFGVQAASDNTGAVVNALGFNAANGNSASYVNAFGAGAGSSNTYEHVNLFGQNASATATAQTVFSKDGSIMARFGYGGLSASRLYTLPDASGTIALTSDSLSTINTTAAFKNAVNTFTTRNNFTSLFVNKDSTTISSGRLWALVLDTATNRVQRQSLANYPLLNLNNNYTYTSTASTPSALYSGTWFTGGTSTTTKPHFLIEPTGTTSTGWSTSGTGFGVNSASGFAGNLLDLQQNGISRFRIPSFGSPYISTRGGQFVVGISDNSTNNLGIRFLTLSTGFSYIDGFSEGNNKNQNYDIVIGSRVANTGLNITGNTTAETGTNVQIGFQTATIPSSILTLNTTTRGFLPPRMTATQAEAISSPAEGLMIYSTNGAGTTITSKGWWGWNGTTWEKLNN